MARLPRSAIADWPIKALLCIVITTLLWLVRRALCDPYAAAFTDESPTLRWNLYRLRRAQCVGFTVQPRLDAAGYGPASSRSSTP
jgi:hypothetical protein